MLPWRVMHEPIPDGPSAGMYCPPEELSAMLDRSYALRGWDQDGVPTKERLSTLAPHTSLSHVFTFLSPMRGGSLSPSPPLGERAG